MNFNLWQQQQKASTEYPTPAIAYTNNIGLVETGMYGFNLSMSQST